MHIHPQAELLQQQLEKANKIAIICHNHADGDALGSSLALGYVLEQQGKQVSYFNAKPISERFAFLEHPVFSPTRQNNMFDTLICLDTGDTKLLEPLWQDIQQSLDTLYTIVIDHHLTNTSYGDCNIVDASASSTCELLTELLLHIAPEYINTKVATALLMGIETDTGHLMYEKDSVRTLDIYTHLIKKGADKKTLMYHLYENTPPAYLQLLKKLIERTQTKGKVIYSRYQQEDLQASGLDKEVADGYVHELQKIHHEGVYLLCKESTGDLNPIVKCSLRTKSDTINVADLAEHYFHGGGHRKAAGGKYLIEKDIPHTVEKIVDIVNRYLETR